MIPSLEVAKGVVWDHGPVTMPNGTIMHKTAVVLVVLTREPIPVASKGGEVVMGSCAGLSAALGNLDRYEDNASRGSADQILVGCGAWNPAKMTRLPRKP